MFDLPFHPIAVHIPLTLSVLMPILIGIVLWGQKKEWFSPKTWLLLIFLQTLLVGTGFVAMQLGELDGEKVERVVAESFIEAHEEWAEVFVWTGACLLIVMVVPAVIVRARFFKPLSLAGAVLALIPAIYTGHSGGQLVYRHGAARVFQETPKASQGEAERHKNMWMLGSLCTLQRLCWPGWPICYPFARKHDPFGRLISFPTIVSLSPF